MEEFYVGTVGAETEDAHAKVVLLAVDFAVEARVADCSVDPVVEAVPEVAGVCVGVPDAEAREEDFFVVGDVVAVGVFQEKEVGCVGDDDPAPGEGEGGGDVEAVCKGCGLVCATIPIGIFEDFDAVIAFAVGGDGVGVVNGLGDPKAALVVPLYIDRVNDIGLRREELQVETDGGLGVLEAGFRGKGELVGEGLGAVFVVGNVVALFVSEGLAGCYELFIASFRFIPNCQKDAGFHKLVEPRVVPDAMVMSGRGVEDTAFPFGAHPCPRFGLGVRVAGHGFPYHEDGAVLGVVLVVEVGLVPGFEFGDPG